MSRPAAGAASPGNFCGEIRIISPVSAMAATSVRPTTVTGSRHGGCDFAANPGLGWRHANIFWRPDVAADVVSFVRSPPRFDDGPTVDDLRHIATAERIGIDGLHLLWGDELQIWVSAQSSGHQRLVALLPVDRLTERRAKSATSVARRLRGLRPVAGPVLTRQVQERHALRLRALDGARAGASSRDIAMTLFGRTNVPSGTAWKSSDVRSHTFRLLADARSLSSGGYLRLLR